MSVWEEVKQSNLWDPRFQLPLIPMHSNPWIYCAYFERVFFKYLGAQDSAEYMAALKRYFELCEAMPGFIMRWPTDPNTSHDELLGAAFLSPPFAARAIDFLSRHDGSYSLGEPTIRDNMYRFIFMLPALKAFAGFQVSLFSQALFGLALLSDAFFGKVGDASGTLKLWLCAPAMRKFPITAACISIWEKRLLARGQSPKEIFSKHYLTECPIFREYAREDFS